jgi:hypothetical protein
MRNWHCGSIGTATTDGDAAVVQLVRVETKSTILPLVAKYQRDRKLPSVADNVYAAVEDRYAAANRGALDVIGGGDESNDYDDCGFGSQIIGSADVDAAIKETCRCI